MKRNARKRNEHNTPNMQETKWFLAYIDVVANRRTLIESKWSRWPVKSEWKSRDLEYLMKRNAQKSADPLWWSACWSPCCIIVHKSSMLFSSLDVQLIFYRLFINKTTKKQSRYQNRCKDCPNIEVLENAECLQRKTRYSLCRTHIA